MPNAKVPPVLFNGGPLQPLSDTFFQVLTGISPPALFWNNFTSECHLALYCALYSNSPTPPVLHVDFTHNLSSEVGYIFLNSKYLEPLTAENNRAVIHSPRFPLKTNGDWCFVLFLPIAAWTERPSRIIRAAIGWIKAWHFHIIFDRQFHCPPLAEPNSKYYINQCQNVSLGCSRRRSLDPPDVQQDR